MEWKARTDPELWKGLGRKGWRQGERRDIDLKSKVRGQVQPGGMVEVNANLNSVKS